MSGIRGWSDLPEELLPLIKEHLSSSIDFIRIRSICKPWRSTITTREGFTNRFQCNLPFFRMKKTLVSPMTFFRVTLPSSSSPNKGWLIKHRQISESSKIHLFSPLSGQLLTPSEQTLDLMKFGVSEIRQSYNVQYLKAIKMDYTADVRVRYKIFANSDRVVLLDNRCFVVFNNEIQCCKIGEYSKRSRWTRIRNEEVENFLDITLHKGQLYALDLTGAIWWISLSDQLSLYKYGPSTPLDQYCGDKRLVEYCGELCVIHCFCKPYSAKGGDDKEGTIGFRVYKMDKELVNWVEVNSLGDKTLIVAMDSCFTVVASEYYGCLENAIYFNVDEDIGVFKLDDGSIVTKLFDPDVRSYQSCFQMFFPPFVSSFSPKVLDSI